MAETTKKVGVELFVSKGDAARGEFKQTSEEIRKVGDATEETNRRFKVASEGVASSSRAAGAAMGVQSQAARGAAVGMSQLQQIYENVVKTQGANSVAAQVLAAELGNAGKAAGAHSVTVQGVEQTTKKAAEATGFWNNILSTHTSQISTSGTIFKGYDNILQAVIRSTGGVSIAVGLGISVLGALAEKLIHAGGEKQKHIELDKELITTTIVLRDAWAALVQGGNAMSETFRENAEVQNLLIRGDLIGIFGKINDEQVKVAESGRELDKAYQSLNSIIGRTEYNQGLFGSTTAQTTPISNDFSKAVGTATAAHQTNIAALEKQVETLLQFAAQTRMSGQALVDLAREVHQTVGVIDLLTERFGQATIAEIEFMAAMHRVKLAQIDASATTEGLAQNTNQLNESLQRHDARLNGMAAGQKSFNENLILHSAAIHQVIKDTEQRIAVEHRGELTSKSHANATTLLREELAKMPGVVGQYAVALLDSDNAHKAFGASAAGAHNKGAAAARQHELAVNSLTKQIREAQAALVGDNFASRDAKISADIAAEGRAYLLRRKRAELTSEEEAQFAALSLARHEKVLQDKFAAEQRFADELRQMQIRGITDAYDRERAQVAFQLEKKAESLVQEFGLNRETTDKIMAYKRATEDEFTRWFIDRNMQAATEINRIHGDMLRSETAERAREGELWLKEAVKRFEQQQAQEQALIRELGKHQARPGAGISPTPNMGIIAQDVAMLNKLGLTVAEVDKRFGSASRSEQQLHDRLVELNKEGVAARGVFGQLTEVMTAHATALRESQTDAERWSDFLTNAVNQMGSNIEQGFEGLVNGTTTFAQLMKKIIFDLIASMAEQWGAYYLALGIADIFWNPALGAAELAAGAALMALAGVLHALGGSGASKAATGASAGGVSSGASGGSNATTGGNTVVHQPQPIIIDLSSLNRQQGSISVPAQAPANSQPTIVHTTLQFDASRTADAVVRILESKGVVTLSSMKGQHHKHIKRMVEVNVKPGSLKGRS